MASREGNGGGGGGFRGGYAYLGDEEGSCCGGSGGSGYIGTMVSDGVTTQNVTSPSGSYYGYATITWIAP